jgi:hypothetical protein
MKECFGNGESGSVMIIDFLKGQDMNAYMAEKYSSNTVPVDDAL